MDFEKLLKKTESFDAEVTQHKEDKAKADLKLLAADPEFTTGAILGPAGTGKTTKLMKASAEHDEGRGPGDKKWALLAATTGIAAVNLGSGVSTINSALRYFDTASLQEASNLGRLRKTLDSIAKDHKLLVIDELSMLDGEQLDILHLDLVRHNDRSKNKLGLMVTGDFLQLPPIKAKWAFDALAWAHYEANLEQLTKIYRQQDPKFRDAMGHFRHGDGAAGVPLLKDAGVEFTNSLDLHFPGTTIMAKNDEVIRYNAIRMGQIQKPLISVNNFRWGKPDGSWKHIPNLFEIKETALVMILANDAPDFNYANGDLGTVVQANPEDNTFHIELARTDETVRIGRVRRRSMAIKHPKGKQKTDAGVTKWSAWVPIEVPKRDEAGFETGEMRTVMIPNEEPEPWDMEYWDPEAGKWCLGAIDYFPLRLGYATTVHKSQGLTLDKVQINPRSNFFGSPGMAYVALSRARSPEGMRVVSNPAQLAKRVIMAEGVDRWV